MPLFFDKSSLTSGKQAQQDYRFVLRINGIDVALIKNVTSPSYTTELSTYSMLEYQFKYPQAIKWNGKVDFDVLQIIDKDIFTTTIGFFMSKLYNADYYASPMGIGSGERDAFLPNSLYKAKDTIASYVNNGPSYSNGYVRSSNEGTVLDYSKQKLTSNLGRVIINTLDDDGEVYDCWKLNQAFITSVVPSNLTYDSEKVSTVKVSLSYDWASYGFRGVFAEEDVVSRIFGI